MEGDEHLLGVRVGQGHEPVDPVRDQVRRGSAEPDRDQRPEDRFAGHPDEQLGPRGGHRLDQVAAQAGAEQRRELPGRPAHGVGGVEAEPHPSRGALVQHAVGHRLERNRAPRRRERGHRLVRPVDDGAREHRQPEGREHVLHLRGLQPPALRPIRRGSAPRCPRRAPGRCRRPVS